MEIPLSVQHRAMLLKRHWAKEMGQEAAGPTWDPERQAWWVTMNLGDTMQCGDELHELTGTPASSCPRDAHDVAVGIRFVRTKRNHGTWSDGNTCRIMMDGVEVNGMEFSKLASILAKSTKFGSSHQDASSQSSSSSTLDTKKNTVIRV